MTPWIYVALFSTLSALTARADLCQILHASLESGKPVHEILPEAVQLFTQVASEQKAIAPESRERFLDDPFSFPAHELAGTEFRSTLTELQKTFHAAKDHEAIREATRERLAGFRVSAASREAGREAERKTTPAEAQPIRFARRMLSGAPIGNGDRLITEEGLLLDLTTDKLVDVAALGLGKFPKWTYLQRSPDLQLVRKAQEADEPIDWNVYIASPTLMTKVKLSKSPYPSNYFLRHFGNETTPGRLDGQLSADGKTLLVVASSLVKKGGIPQTENGVRASIYDAVTGKFIGAVPAARTRRLTGDGRSWTESRTPPTATLSQDGQKVWISARYGHVSTWWPKEKRKSPGSHSFLDEDEAVSPLVQSPDGQKLYIMRHGVMSTYAAANSSLMSMAPLTPGLFTEDRSFRWETVQGTHGRTLVMRDANHLEKIVFQVELPEDTDFKDSTPDGSRLIFETKSQNRNPTWFALYSLQDLKRFGYISSPTEWEAKQK